jgi:hypothetical protein
MITIPNCIATVVLAWFSCLFFPFLDFGILEDVETRPLTGWMSGWFLSGKKCGFVSLFLDFMVFPGCIGRRLYRAIVVVSCCTHTLVLDSMVGGAKGSNKAHGAGGLCMATPWVGGTPSN